MKREIIRGVRIQRERYAPPPIENLLFSIEVEENDRVVEVLGRLANADPAIVAYDECRRKAPQKLILLRHNGRVIRRSDR